MWMALIFLNHRTEAGYWVGKQSLKAWKRMAHAIYLSKDDEKPGANGNDGDESDSDAHVNGKPSSDVKEEESAMAVSDDDSGKDVAATDGSVSPPCKKYVIEYRDPNMEITSSSLDVGSMLKLLCDNLINRWPELLCMASVPPQRLKSLEEVHEQLKLVAKGVGDAICIAKNIASSRYRRKGATADHSPEPNSPTKGCKRDKDGAVKVNGDIVDVDKEAEYNIEEEFNEDVICSHGKYDQ